MRTLPRPETDRAGPRSGQYMTRAPTTMPSGSDCTSTATVGGSSATIRWASSSDLSPRRARRARRNGRAILGDTPLRSWRSGSMASAQLERRLGVAALAQAGLHLAEEEIDLRRGGGSAGAGRQRLARGGQRVVVAELAQLGPGLLEQARLRPPTAPPRPRQRRCTPAPPPARRTRDSLARRRGSASRALVPGSDSGASPFDELAQLLAGHDADADLLVRLTGRRYQAQAVIARGQAESHDRREAAPLAVHV